MEENNCKKLLTNPKQIPNDEELFKEILSKQLHQTYKEIQKIKSGFGFLRNGDITKMENPGFIK